ncbi:MAG: helix-turn-helix domain-containing protein [Candidatus Omnitrophica bacterium]|nr:helix-turn-helix domain-containing protein [Candidatus Omnitrophota bacterium]
MEHEILTVEQVAQLLHLHVMTVYRLAKQGKLPGFKVGGRWRFQREVLSQWMVDRAQISRLQAEENNSLKKEKNDDNHE